MASEREPEQSLDRRRLLARMSAWAMMLAGHSLLAGEDGGPQPTARTGDGDDDAEARILALRLLTGAPLAEMRAFYGGLLGLPVVAEREGEVVVAAGASEITFIQVAADAGSPFYHFAFNIPENKILAARAWQLERTPLFLTPEDLRDAAYPDDVRHFRSWNAHSVFFWDPAGNVLEYIARHDLGNGASGGFSPRDILYASEIGFVVDDVPSAGASLEQRLALTQYRNGSDQFRATGDERGLLLLFKRGRDVGDTLRDRPAPAAVFPTRAVIRGVAGANYRFAGHPHEIAAG